MKIKLLTAAVGLAGFFAAAYSVPVHAESAASKVIVQPGDTLSGIATAKQTTYVRLYNANPAIEHPDVIHPGDELRVPLPEEQLPDRPLPGAGGATGQAVVRPAAVSSGPSGGPKKAPAATAVNGDVWEKLAKCESGGNWAINTGNGYYGGLQFTLSSWRGVGGTGYPHQASKAEQINRAQALLARQGWGAWPACTAKLGLR